MLFGLVVQDQRNLDLVVLCYRQIVFNDELLPNLNDLLEERLGVD